MGTLGHPFAVGRLRLGAGRATPLDAAPPPGGSFEVEGGPRRAVVRALPGADAPAAAGGAGSIEILE